MEVTLQFNNAMEQYYPQKTLFIAPKENALFFNLFQAIGSLKNLKLPESIWNYFKDRFNGLVMISSCVKFLIKETKNYVKVILLNNFS
jgi:hypothetical protein